MKSITPFIIALMFLAVSCENIADKTETSTVIEETSDNGIIAVQLSDFNEKAETLVGEQIVLTGMVDHVCKHGGQKFFLVNENADARIKVVTGKNMAAFNTELEGETVQVIGVVDELRIDEEYLREWEEEVLAGLSGEEGEKGEKVHMGEGEGEHHEDEENPDLAQINAYRTKIAESGKDYISFFSVICVEYDVDKTDKAAAEEGV